MRRLVVALGALIVSSGAAAMPVSTFLAKAEALKARGPLAIFSGDLKLLTNQIKSDAGQLRADNAALAKAGRAKAYCTPAGAKLTDKEILAAMQAVPAAERTTMQTKDALRQHLSRAYPCSR